uniref:Uncharacterized protein n=1 Tax=Plectus sambesii TaxID=2011161 RepID=A0A914UJ50_9BILA
MTDRCVAAGNALAHEKKLIRRRRRRLRGQQRITACKRAHARMPLALAYYMQASGANDARMPTASWTTTTTRTQQTHATSGRSRRLRPVRARSDSLQVTRRSGQYAAAIRASRSLARRSTSSSRTDTRGTQHKYARTPHHPSLSLWVGLDGRTSSSLIVLAHPTPTSQGARAAVAAANEARANLSTAEDGRNSADDGDGILGRRALVLVALLAHVPSEEEGRREHRRDGWRAAAVDRRGDAFDPRAQLAFRSASAAEDRIRPQRLSVRRRLLSAGVHWTLLFQFVLPDSGPGFICSIRGLRSAAQKCSSSVLTRASSLQGDSLGSTGRSSGRSDAALLACSSNSSRRIGTKRRTSAGSGRVSVGSREGSRIDVVDAPEENACRSGYVDRPELARRAAAATSNRQLPSKLVRGVAENDLSNDTGGRPAAVAAAAAAESVDGVQSLFAPSK